MDKSTAARIGIAGTVAALGLTAGGVAMASAESDSTDATATASAHPGGHRGEGGQRAGVLATELGLDQEKVQEALDTVRKELRSEAADDADGKRTPPTEEERTARQAALVSALATELGVSEDKVTAAFEAVKEQAEANREERSAAAREKLVERLDAAVADGTLTEADQASVLKAYDADLLGGAKGGGKGGPRGGGPAASGSAS